MQRLTFTVLVAGFLVAFGSPSAFADDDHNPIGVTGAFEGVITTGCAVNVLNHNATRQIDDIVVPGSIGKYPLKMTRYYNSRDTVYPGLMAPGWRHEYQWAVLTSHSWKVEYPNGKVWDSECFGDVGAPLGGSDGWASLACNTNCVGDFRLADGGTVHFDNTNSYFQARTIKDPYGQTTTLTYYTSGPQLRLLSRVTEPGGRYLQFTYAQVGGQQMLSQVDAYDGQGNRVDYVVYHYASQPTGGNIVTTAMCLTSVDYSDGQHATYTYTTDNNPDNPSPPCPCPQKLLPLLQTCQDVRYKGPMRQICYEYQIGGPHGAIIAERYSLNGSTNGPRVSRIDPPAPSPLLQFVTFPTTYTETRGDTPTRTFNYTSLSLGRPAPEETCPSLHGPAPQQFLLNYTDFQGHTTYLGYDANWYVDSVTDANNHTTTYTRGPPPGAYPGPKGIGQILRITHPDTTHVDYTYYDESPNISGHYVQTVSNERQKITTYTRDPTNRLVTRIDYPSDASTPVSYEEFAYNSFGQVLTHHLRNGAYESFAYDGRGLLTDKYNPKQSGVPGGSDPHTHYTYYISGPWTDRVQAMTLPANAGGYQASETYEYDNNAVGSPVAGRGLVTKITHADGTYQSFGYDAYGNKLWEENELRQRTNYTYDDYNRVLTVKNPLNQTVTKTYTPTNGTGTSPYLHTTDNPDTVTTPTGIVIKNIYDQNFRKTSTTAAYGTASAATTTFGYDNVGNPTAVADPLSHTTTTTYDTRNRKTMVTEASGTALARTTTWNYDGASNVTSIVRPDNTTETKTYDALNRVLTDTVPQTSTVNLTTTFTHNPSGTIASVKDANLRVTTFEYDASDQKTKMTYPDNSTQSWAYDNAHNLKNRKTVAGEIQNFAYDQRNRKSLEWWDGWPADGEWRVFRYDDANNLTLATNGIGTYWTNFIADVRRFYDNAGRMSLEFQTVYVNGVANVKDVNYVYDADGKEIRMYVPSAGYDYTFSYDAMGRFETIVAGATTVAQYSYDNASNEIQRLNNATGVAQIYTRDALNRMSRRDIKKGANTLSYEAYGYDAMSRLTSVSREDGKTDSFTYYKDGELNTATYDATSTPTPTPTPTPAPSPTPTPTPTPGGQVQTPTFVPDGGDVSGCAYNYTYHVTIQSATSGALIRYTLDGSTPTPTHGTQIANGGQAVFTVAGHTTLKAMAYKSGMTNSNVRSADYYFHRDCGQGPMAPEIIRAVTYNLDKAGNRTSVTDNVNGNASYTPNTLNQYTAVTGSSIANGPEHEVSSYQGPDDAQLVIYGYINDERLSSVTSGSNTYFLYYDALGRCVKRTLNGVDTYYVYDGEKPILEYNPTGGVVGWNLYGKGIDEIIERVAYSSSNAWVAYFFQQDHEGNVTHLTSATGTVLEKYRYDVFGAPTIYNGSGAQIAATAYDNRFLFTGREYAATYRSIYNTGFKFYEYRARAYHASLGRFMSEDPKLFDAGDYNLFRYCHNDPIDNVDPMGLTETGDFLAGFDSFATFGIAEGIVGRFNPGYAATINTSSTAYNAGVIAGVAAGVFDGATEAKALGKLASRAFRRDAITKTVEHKASTGYRYVSKEEAKSIKNSRMRVPTVNKVGEPKPVFFTNERFTTGAEARKALSMPSTPEFRVEFNIKQAPAGYGGLTEGGAAEFTLREGAQPIQANKVVPLSDTSLLDQASRHIPPKLDQ
jgi:RHS repeat-associated protein